MNAEMPALTLCVPTYNRAALLRQSLTALFSQISPEEAAQLEVLVMDNASPDQTPEIVAEFGQRWPHVPLRYIRNPENIGPDGNFLEGIALARGRFVFLVSDDDLLLPGAVAALLRLIEAHPDFDGFSLNARTFKRSPDEEGRTWFPLAEDCVLRSGDDVLALLQTSLGFMSILAFNKSRIAGRLESGHYQEKRGTNFLQAFLFLDVLAAGKGVVVLAEPLLAQRADNSPLDNYFRVFVTGINAVLAYARQAGFSEQVIRRIKTKNLVDVRHFVSSVRIHGHGQQLWPSRPDAIRRLFRMYGFRPYLWLVVVPLMFFPRSLGPIVLGLRRLLGRPDINPA
jgi:abequosyltransferase